MEQLLIKYKELKKQIVGELGLETSTDMVMWNDGVIESMEKLLKNVDPDIAKMIRLGYL